MATYLDRILEEHRLAARADHRDLDALLASARGGRPTRKFAERIAADSQRAPAVIAEIKRRSPSKGQLAVESLRAHELATTYERGGASCLSVLTDEKFFDGSTRDLRDAHDAVALPILRKDFTVGAHDVVDARLMGADCVLLIVAALDDAELKCFHDLAVELGLDVLAEIHDERELERALAAGATLIGVNQRDLVTFDVDHERALRMAKIIPDDAVKVAESGIRGRDDVARLYDAGYQAVLVGEHLMRSGDPATAIAELRGM